MRERFWELLVGSTGCFLGLIISQDGKISNSCEALQ